MYKIKSMQENDLTFVIVLKDIYNYEIMEFSNPGSLTIRFFQDAYYTEEEKHPEQMVYFLRTDAVKSDEELAGLLHKYQDEKPTQIKNQEGDDILVIGEYDTEKEAEQVYEQMLRKYGTEFELFVSSGKVEEIPEK